jgi:hypothetical protein
MFGSSFCFTSDNRRSTRVAKTVINKDKGNTNGQQEKDKQ